jgi:hypothetical protein
MVIKQVPTCLEFKGKHETDRVMIENFRIRVFRAVAQHLNFSRAAEELLLTQPAITRQIKALEDELGVPLFDRGPAFHREYLVSQNFVATCNEAFGESAIGHRALGGRSSLR